MKSSGFVGLRLEEAQSFRLLGFMGFALMLQLMFVFVRCPHQHVGVDRSRRCVNNV